jgi:drug/metabolite transporter (DMT)-like permease
VTTKRPANKTPQGGGLGKAGAYGAGVLLTLIIGFSFLGVKVCVGIASPFETLAWRYNFACLPALFALLFGAVKPRLGGEGLRDFVLTAGFYTACMILQAIGLLYASSVESGIFFAVIPVFVKVLASILIKEHATRKQNFFMCLSVGSLVAMIVCGAGDITMHANGAVILLAASLCMAFSNVFMRRVRNRRSAAEIAVALAFAGFVACNAVALFLALKGGGLREYFSVTHNLRFLAATAYLGVLSTFCTGFLMGYMTKRLEAVKAAVFGNMASAISVAAGAVFLREPLHWYHIVFTLFILAGVVGVSASGARPAES